MLSGLISILWESPVLFLIVATILIFSLSIHELSHALMANYLGDDTAKRLGRISLNPKKHLDPFGTIMLLLFGFGWAKPVPFNPYLLKNPKRDAALISLAGPASNILVALILGFAWIILKTAFGGFDQSNNLVKIIFSLAAYYNIFLAVFNLIPIDPLDGFKIVNGILPQKLSVQWIQTAPYGVFILIFVVLSGFISNVVSPIVGILHAAIGF